MSRRSARALVGLASLVLFGAGPGLTLGLPAANAAQPPPPATSPPLSMFTATENLKAPPPVIDARGLDPGSRDASGAVPVSLDEVTGTHRFHTQLGASPSFGYLPAGATASDVYLGPTIEAKRGVPIKLTVTNKLVRPTSVPGGSVDAPTGLAAIHPYAQFFDPTIMGGTELDKYAPRTALHLHGGHTPPKSDGGPDDAFRPAGLDAVTGAYTDDYAIENGQPAGQFTYEYPNDQEATTLWYHDHALGITRLNPAAGLAAFYLIRDDFDTGRAGNPLGLPVSTPGGSTYEWPLVLQDRMFKDLSGALNYPTNATGYHPTWAPESFGDVSTVNGQAWPNLNVDRGLYRFRLLNGSNARFYNLILTDQKTGNPTKNVAVYQIGSEGGMFNRPVAITSTNPGLLIAPGQRADLLVDFRQASAGSKFQWYNNANAPYPSGPNSVSRGGVPIKRIIQFSVGSAAGFSPPAGTPLASLPNAPLRGAAGEAPAIVTPTPTPGALRTVFLNEVIDPVTGTPVEVLLNNLTFHDIARSADGTPLRDDQNMLIPTDALRTAASGIATAKLNTTEVWQIVNTTMDSHPIHLHMTQFQVLNRQNVDSAAYLAAVNPLLPTTPAEGGTGVQNSSGAAAPPDPARFVNGALKPPSAKETGWKDTVVSNPGEVLRIVVPFGGTAGGLSAPFTGDPANAVVQQFVGNYVWHCHILEHEENDMMQTYAVQP